MVQMKLFESVFALSQKEWVCIPEERLCQVALSIDGAVIKSVNTPRI